MSLLRSIFTVLGNSHPASAYDPSYSSRENGGGYYTSIIEDGQEFFVLQQSLTSDADHDAFMPERYAVQQNKDATYIPPLIRSIQTGRVVSNYVPIDKDMDINQIITTIPVMCSKDAKIKGVLQFRSSDRGLRPADEDYQNRLTLAQYMIEALSPLFEPQNPEHITKLKHELDTLDGTIDFLKNVQSIYNKSIAHWSPETHKHTNNVTDLCEIIVNVINTVKEGAFAELQIGKREKELLLLSSELHDIGKLYTPRSILDSGVPVPGVRYKLSKIETAIMEQHAQDVFDILDIPELAYLQIARDTISAHHIYANGEGGYPESVRQLLMREGGISFEGRLLAVCDVFEALSADREYREGIGLSVSTCIRIMGNMAEREQIDSQILRFCIEHSIFVEYAKSKAHISRFDHDILEHIAYSATDIEMARTAKRTISNETGIHVEELEKLFLLYRPVILDMVADNEQKPAADQDPNIPSRYQLDFMDDIKTQMCQEINKRYDSNLSLTSNDVYVYRLLALTPTEIKRLSKLKNELATQIWGRFDNQEDLQKATQRLEGLAKLDLHNSRSLALGAIEPHIYDDSVKQIDALKQALIDKETQDIQNIKHTLLNTLPTRPFDASKPLLLFTYGNHNTQ